jgi:uncharacterized protein YbjT (DUF2867 family)
MDESTRIVAVFGATGRQGGAVARTLAERGWRVRGITRNPRSKPAQALAGLGIEVVMADMGDRSSLRSAFEGAHGVFSVQNGLKAGFEEEVVQGRNVADVAAESGAGHLVYGSAGPGSTPTGVPSWDAKLRVEEHMATLDLRVTVLRPMAFMELTTDKALYPSVGTWNLWPRLMGEDRPVPWLCVPDLGEIAGAVFADPSRFAGRELVLASDVRTLREAREIYEEVLGKEPSSVPMPQWLFDRFTRKDLTTMWRWLRTNPVPLDTRPTREILPSAKTLRGFLTAERARAGK